jgi:hypothetical protein
MENFLVEKNIPCYVPMFETEKIDEKVIEGKVVFSTFHSVKGRERPYVFIMGFDQTYFDFYASNLSYDVCPNTLYVGCTRATHKLFLLESDQYTTDRPLQFLKLNHYQMREKSYIHFKGIPRSVFYVQNKETLSTLSEPAKIEYHDITPTDLIKFVPEVVIEEISPLLDRIFITEKELKPENEIAIPNMIKTSRGLYEDVSDLNGIAIPSIYYDHIQKVFDPDSPNIGANILLSIIHNTMEETKDYEYSFLKEIIAMLPDDCTTPGEYLFLSNVFVATREKLYFKLKQIDDADYTWLSDELISACMQRLDETIGTECQNGNPPLIEHSIINATMDNEIERINLILKPFFPDHKKKFRFHARTDLITDECIWELKCTSTISIEHMLQVVIYQWIWLIVNNPSLGVAAIKKTKIVTKPLRLFNIKTGEILRLNASFDELTTIVVALLRGKYADMPVKSDEDFIKDAVAFTETMVAKYGFGSN